MATLGEIQAKLPDNAKAQKLNLEVTIHGTEAANDWDLWVYPKWRGRPALASGEGVPPSDRGQDARDTQGPGSPNAIVRAWEPTMPSPRPPMFWSRAN